MGSPLLFWDVDTQFDFMLPGGKLYVPGAEQIVPNVACLTRYAQQHRIPLLSSTDAHQPDDSEFAQYPPHCVTGTPGQRKLPETLLPNRLLVPNASVRLPEDLSRFDQFIVEKGSLDVYTNPNINKLLNRLAPREITLYGVVTEICVWLAARDLLDRGYKLHLVSDAIRAFDEQGGRDALKEMTRRGAALTSTAAVTGAPILQAV
jgi:nicotinamidase/pyrazinamidase